MDEEQLYQFRLITELYRRETSKRFPNNRATSHTMTDLVRLAEESYE